MPVDLNKIKPGDTVVFRNGGTALVTKIKPWPGGHDWEISLDVGPAFAFDTHIGFNTQGFFADGNQNVPSVFDIVEVKKTKRPVDWDNIKPGTKLENQDGQTFFFIGPDIEDKQYVIVSDTNKELKRTDLSFEEKKDLSYAD